MSPPSMLPPPLKTTLDDFVVAFESALAGPDRPDLAHFLPPPDSPLYHAVLCELIRVELENDWERGHPLSLAFYRDRFPAAFEDADLLAAVAFEEYRLRRQAGENPDPADYQQRWSVDVKDWPPRHPDADGEPLEGTVRVRGQWKPAEAAPVDDSPLLSAARSYRVFRLHGESSHLDSWLASCPGGPGPGQLFGDLHRHSPVAAERLANGLVSLPRVGETFLGFQLLAELGRGAFGRVYLARQADLANRLVALKIAADVVGESQTLAQLQHTHIVPIYSVHPTGTLQAVCMPYFGAVTLADVLDDLAKRPALPRQGSELLSSLTLRRRSTQNGVQDVPSWQPPSDRRPASDTAKTAAALTGSPQATLKRLEGLSYVEAVVWLGCCLADGLAHAHERGILHRDLKPANILLTDEGQPMLLDFNLAEDTKLRGTATAAFIGGTIPYMAPEQLAAFSGQKVSIDERSDLFSLGLILYELLAGQSPFPRPLPSTNVDVFVAEVWQTRREPAFPVATHNRLVSPAVWSILRRCLATYPADRYASARQLQEDLQRQLDSQPLKHAPELSLRERCRKQFRRSPRLLVKVVAGVAVLLVLIAGGIAALARQSEEVAAAQADAATSKAEQERLEKEKAEAEAKYRRDSQAARDGWKRARGNLHTALYLLNLGEATEQLEDGTRLARAVLEEYEVLRRPEWRERDRVTLLPAEDQDRLIGEVGELLMLLARSRLKAEEALQLLRKAEECFGQSPPPVLWLQQAAVLERLGESTTAKTLAARGQSQPPQLARDHTLMARSLMINGRQREALLPLQRAVLLDANNALAHLTLASCLTTLEQYPLAKAYCDAALGLAPSDAALYNRGFVQVKLRLYNEAILDFDEALRLRPGVAEVYLNRGVAHRALGQIDKALADFSKAIECNPQMTRALFFRADLKRRLRDETGAQRDEQEALKREPRDHRDWNERAQYQMRQKNYQGALASLERGLALNPLSRQCLNAKAHVLGELLRRDREALAVLDEVVKLHPDYLYGPCDRGILRARLGLYEAARGDARLSQLREQTPEMLYRIGCIYALTSQQTPADADQALRLLHSALKGGFGVGYLSGDDDLKPLHKHPGFAELRDLEERLRRPPGAPKNR